MKNKGFTLIELLAVIVILAIIALIAVPIVLGIINSSKEESRSLSKELYLKAVDQAITAKNLDEYFKPDSCTVNEYGNLTCTENGSEVELTIDVDGERPCGGTIIFEDREIKKETLSYCGEINKPEPEPEPEPEPKPEPEVPTGSFATDDWSTIISNVKSGKSDAYKDDIGEEKYVTLNGSEFENKTYKVRLANVESPEDCNNETFSQTACGFVIEFVDIIDTHNMGAARENKGGWPASSMYSYVNEDIYNALPEELQNGIKETKVISGYGKSDSSDLESTDKLYLLSPIEVWGSAPDGYDTAVSKTRQLDYYKKYDVTTSSYSEAIKYLDESANAWWLRTAYFNSDSAFYNVSSNGSPFNAKAPTAFGVSPAFRLG